MGQLTADNNLMCVLSGIKFHKQRKFNFKIVSHENKIMLDFSCSAHSFLPFRNTIKKNNLYADQTALLFSAYSACGGRPVLQDHIRGPPGHPAACQGHQAPRYSLSFIIFI